MSGRKNEAPTPEEDVDREIAALLQGHQAAPDGDLNLRSNWVETQGTILQIAVDYGSSTAQLPKLGAGCPAVRAAVLANFVGYSLENDQHDSKMNIADACKAMAYKAERCRMAKEELHGAAVALQGLLHSSLNSNLTDEEQDH